MVSESCVMRQSKAFNNLHPGYIPHPLGGLSVEPFDWLSGLLVTIVGHSSLICVVEANRNCPQTTMGNGALLSLHKNDGTQTGEMVYNAKRQKRETIIANSAAEQKKIAQAIRITGALGKFADHINDCFVETGVVYNKRTLYQSTTDKRCWLRFTTKGIWMVSSTEHKDENLLAGFCCCRDYGHLDPSYAQIWYVFGNEGVFRIQARVKAIAMNLNEIDSTFLDLKRDSLSAVKIQGATGPHAHKINGVYRRQKVGNQGRHKRASDFFSYQQSSGQTSTLSYSFSGHWLLIQGSNVLAYCHLIRLANPCDALTWHVADAANKFTVQDDMTVKPCDETSTIDRKNHIRRIAVANTNFKPRVNSTDNVSAFRKWDSIETKQSPYMQAVKKLRASSQQKSRNAI